MNLIDKQCKRIKSEKRLGLMMHVVLGYPSLEASRQLILAMAQNRVDFIEMQIPFSDPLGDGPVIRLANTASLSAGFRTKQAFMLAKKLRRKDKVEIPLLFMTYFNIVFNYGVKKFCADAQAAGVNGLIIPDYPSAAETHDHLSKYAKKYNLQLIEFVSLDSAPADIKRAAKTARGFVYCFAQRGVTGRRQQMLEELGGHLKRLKKYIKIPLAVGFGISRPEHLANLKGKADIGIVGSAVLEEYNRRGLSGAVGLVGRLRNG
ncbi:MAG: tryptophan synthase subunit alpha [Candidatus Magasanikbacteria bacterium CG10_big_fil_rev_8_21_14_0_10_40_10]|uniref:Tryptophan synthase alpha chain n=1 Tax=Candidatus Magasanikbacteria bacterium CG10_big_fil_rev_8_21_14_0_10_40_10 TaxID=1974648 RepID=A0A2M6W467_9BACT|nr:MAG: tryptophan synthase subunit alpha [Candidatus Magasanikbacteria bacterium CG10_big_fil_rev_8_21_14_0_10_40_10]